jgi:hypothetical protein
MGYEAGEDGALGRKWENLNVHKKQIASNRVIDL